MAINKDKKEAQDLFDRRNLHKGDWISYEVAIDYYKRAQAYWGKSMEYVGELRILGSELCLKYGVTEIEAINILQGCNVSDIVNKYHRIKNMIPLQRVSTSKITAEEE